MVGVPRSSAMADWPAWRLALVSVKVEVLMEVDVTARLEFCALASDGQESLTFPAMLLLLLLVVTEAPFKLLSRVETLLRGVPTRFLGGFSSADGSARLTLAPRPDVGLEAAMELALVLEVDTAVVVAVVMDALCGFESLLLPLLAGLTLAAEAVGGSPGEAVQLGAGGVEVFSGLAALGLLCWRISGLLRRPCCCCSSVVVPTGAASVFPK